MDIPEGVVTTASSGISYSPLEAFGFLKNKNGSDFSTKSLSIGPH
jgi:hypothetical protein